jgi:hypothetical protein
MLLVYSLLLLKTTAAAMLAEAREVLGYDLLALIRDGE